MALYRPRHFAAAGSIHLFPSVHLMSATATAPPPTPHPLPLVVSVTESFVRKSFRYNDCSKQASTPPLNSSQIIADLLHPLAAIQSFWPSFFPRPLKYSSNFSDIDPIQFVVVLAQEDPSTFSQPFKKIVGVGRAVSDGAFVATICDVAVDPDFQQQGIGRRIVKWLIQDMKSKGGPTGFAVFPPPIARRFFWTIGFRSDRKYRFMVYKGRPLKPKAEHWNEMGSIG